MRALVVLVWTCTLAHAADSFACIRLVRAQAGNPSTPTITVPTGYSLRDGPNYGVAAPGEYHVFIAGPSGDAMIHVSWPGVAIAAIIEHHSYLAPAGDLANGDASCTVAVRAPSIELARDTLDVASYLDESDLAIRLDHNHPARRSGWYLANPWPTTQSLAAPIWEISARLVLRDWGLHHREAAAGAGRLSILGFESVNPLHIDFPPHWHLIEYLSGQAGTAVPHYYMDDARGALSQNKIQVLDQHSQNPDIFLGPGQVFTYRGVDGSARFVSRIRSDGGLDLGPSESDWRYAIVAGADGGFTNGVTVLKNGTLLATVSVTDDVARGVTSIHITNPDGSTSDEMHLYDPLTGRPRDASAPTPAPAYGIADPVAWGSSFSRTGAESNGSNRSCGIGSVIGLIAAGILLHFARVRSAAAASWRATSNRLRAWSHHGVHR